MSRTLKVSYDCLYTTCRTCDSTRCQHRCHDDEPIPFSVTDKGYGILGGSLG